MTTPHEKNSFIDVWQEPLDNWPLGKSVLQCPLCESHTVRILNAMTAENGRVTFECRCENKHWFNCLFITHNGKAPAQAFKFYAPQN